MLIIPGIKQRRENYEIKQKKDKRCIKMLIKTGIKHRRENSEIIQKTGEKCINMLIKSGIELSRENFEIKLKKGGRCTKKIDLKRNKEQKRKLQLSDYEKTETRRLYVNNQPSKISKETL
jgi:hypothetical protein